MRVKLVPEGSWNDGYVPPNFCQLEGREELNPKNEFFDPYGDYFTCDLGFYGSRNGILAVFLRQSLEI